MFLQRAFKNSCENQEWKMRDATTKIDAIRGQIKSEWIYEIANWPKIATVKFEGFMP